MLETAGATMPTPETPREAAPIAIRFCGVSKDYRLYDRPNDRMLDQLGIDRFMFWRPRAAYHNFHALSGIDLSIHQGERVGIIGRNGAGKTTLLKLITQNFAPSTGAVEVHGSVQALMQLGIGFHPEFSGYENIKAALDYNGLTGRDFKDALQEVVDFVELGEFLHQPMKTYSLGMNARVQFAAATAIRPDILIVDEVLGAGDAYFAAKSAHRMERLTASGCTLLLVSHSTAQVLQFCQRGIFMHEGKVKMDGRALDVVKVYEEFIADLTQKEREAQTRAHSEALAFEATAPVVAQHDYATPKFQQEQFSTLLVGGAGVNSTKSAGEISRWAGEKGLKLSRVEVFNDKHQATGIVDAGKPCSIEVDIVAEDDGEKSFRVVFLIMTLEGVAVIRHLSDPFRIEMKPAEKRTVRLSYDKLLLAQGDFVFSAALFKRYDPDDSSTAIRYDLLSRSFALKVVPLQRSEPAVFNHPCTWHLSMFGQDAQAEAATTEVDR
jgi:lipopolysaccharide transport system ATP-binding protein